MVRHHCSKGNAYQVTNDGAMRPANATVDDSEDGACPLFDHVLPANVRRTGYETPVQRVQAVESPEDKSHDKAVKIPDSIKDESPRERVVSVLEACTTEHGTHPAIVVCLDAATGDALVRTDAHPRPRKLPKHFIFKKRFLEKVRDISFDVGTRNLDAANDFDLEGSLSEAEKSRNTLRAHRRGHDKRCSNKRRNISPVSGSSRRRKRSSQGELLEDVDYEEDFELDVIDEFEGVQTELKQLRIDSLDDWYDFAFRSMSQLALKDIAKAWIRTCVPRKQSCWPYNGGHRAAESLASFPRTNYRGHYTRPDWWPSDEGWNDPDGATGCRHREPDHIKKLERLILVKHLLRYGHQFVIDLMKESTSKLDQKSRREFPQKTMDRLAEIYQVREREIRWENGEIDDDATITVSMPKPKDRAKRKIRPKKPVSIKAESPVPQSAVQQVVPAPVADMGPYTSLKAAQVEADDHEKGVPVAENRDDDVKVSMPPDSASSITEVTPPEELESFPSQRGNRAPSHGLPTPAQLEDLIPCHPYTVKHGLKVPRSFRPSPRSELRIVDDNRGFSGQAACEQAPAPQTETALSSHVTTIGGHHITTAAQDFSALALPSSTSRAAQSCIQRSQIHGRKMKIADRQRRPSRNYEDTNVHATQTYVVRPSPHSRPIAPQSSAFAGYSAGPSSFDTMTPVWVNDQALIQQQSLPYHSIYNEGADPSAVLVPSANTSFSSNLSDNMIDSMGGFVDTRNEPFMMPMSQQEQDEIRAQYPTFLEATSYDIPASDPAALMFSFPPIGSAYPNDVSMDFETKYNQFPPATEHRL